MKLRTTILDDWSRRRLLASAEGVLIFIERRRDGLWCLVGCHLVVADEVPLSAPDIQEAFACVA